MTKDIPQSIRDSQTAAYESQDDTQMMLASRAVQDWQENTRPVKGEYGQCTPADPPAAYEVASDPEAVAYHQAHQRVKAAQIKIIETLLADHGLAGLAQWIVDSAMRDTANQGSAELTAKALQSILHRGPNLDDEIPW